MMFVVWYAEKNDLLPKCVANFGFIVCLEVLNRFLEDKWVFYVSIFYVYIHGFSLLSLYIYSFENLLQNDAQNKTIKKQFYDTSNFETVIYLLDNIMSVFDYYINKT